MLYGKWYTNSFSAATAEVTKPMRVGRTRGSRCPRIKRHTAAARGFERRVHAGAAGPYHENVAAEVAHCFPG
jgi:hypothetical protein